MIIGPFNGPLVLLLRPAIAALAAGNCWVLKLSEKLNSTSELLLDLVPKYFAPSALLVNALIGEMRAMLSSVVIEKNRGRSFT